MGLNLERIQDSKLMPIHLGGGAVCALFLAIGWFFGLSPLLTENQQATTVVTEADQAESTAKQGRAEVQLLTTQLEQVKTRLEQQPVSLEPASQINPLLNQLAIVSKSHRLSITRTQAGRPIALAYYDYVPITVSGEGLYADLLAMFDTLHDKRGDLGLIAFKVKRLGSDARLSFDIQLAWYVISDNPAGTPGPATAAVKTP